MEGKRYWIVEGKNFDTHWTTQTDRVSFKSDDLWKFMEEYHEHKLKLLGIADVVDSEERTELPASTIPEFGTDEWIDCCEQLFGGMRKSR
jgi:hypothetical protein